MYAKIINKLEKELRKIQINNKNAILQAEKSIIVIKASLKELRKIVLSTKFKSQQDEIVFFKTVKPKLIAKLVYFINLFESESKRPKGSVKVQMKYFEAAIQKLQDYFTENHIYYQYFRGNEIYSDKQFFLRKNKSVRIHLDCFGSYIDDEFATNLDTTFAKFIGYELSIQYFQNEIKKLRINANEPQQEIAYNSNLNWTANKVDLVEVIYSFGSSDVINNGDVDIKEIAIAFETLFNIDLGDYYRTFLEIKDRKKSATKFLNFLKSNLEKRIEESEK